MSLQARLSAADNRLYNPGRDIAHNFADVARIVAARLEGRAWPEVARYLEAHKLGDADMAEACRSFCLFVAGACDEKGESMQQCLERVGWFDVPDQAQVAYMAVLGTVMAGYYWAGVHEATLGGEGPCSSAQDLKEVGERAAVLLAAPPWLRWWLRLKEKVRSAWSAWRK